MNSWVFRHLDRLRSIYGDEPGRTSELPLVTPAPLAQDGLLEVAGPVRGPIDPSRGGLPAAPDTDPFDHGSGPGWDRGGPSLN